MGPFVKALAWPALPAAALFVSLGLVAASTAQAAGWPERTIHLIVPLPAGGGSDVLARDMAQFMGKELDATIVVDNKPGAGGVIGGNYVAKAKADGYTLLFNQGGVGSTEVLTQKNPPYDPVKDLSPIILMGRGANTLSVATTSPFQTVADVIKAAKANPGKLTYGSPGIGTPGHLSAELFQSLTGTKLQHVPFSGGAPLVTNLIGGQIDLSFDTVAGDAPMIKAGKMRGLLIASDTRSPTLPEVPTGAEAGIKGWESYSWYALSGPANLPPEVIGKINKAANDYIVSQEGAQRLDSMGLLPQRGGAPEKLGSYVKDEITRLAPVIKAAGITSD